MAGSDQQRSDDARKAWGEVGKRFAEVGRRVGERYRSLGGDRGETAGQAGKAVNDAVQNVVRQLDHAFTSVGDTLRDPEAKDSLQKAVRTFGQALEATFSEAARRLRKPEA